jgi:hypothetical protein
LRRDRTAALAILAAVALAAAPFRPAAASRLAYPALGSDERPVLILAQRAIERSWGASEESIYVERDIPDWRSEGWAAALSATLPGLGQAYAGDERRGLWFALAEVAGWVSRRVYRHRGAELGDLAARFAGAPDDSASRWSFARWQGATASDPAEIEALYRADRDAFYDLIANDPRYALGWGGEDSRTSFRRSRETAEVRLRFARYAGMALWLNHLAASVDALRAARNHNLPLLPSLELKTRTGLRSGRPTVTVAVERRF